VKVDGLKNRLLDLIDLSRKLQKWCRFCEPPASPRSAGSQQKAGFCPERGPISASFLTSLAKNLGFPRIFASFPLHFDAQSV
jgi:hypothetical protein